MSFMLKHSTQYRSHFSAARRDTTAQHFSIRFLQKMADHRKDSPPDIEKILCLNYSTVQVSPARIMSRRVEKPFFARTSSTCWLTPSL